MLQHVFCALLNSFASTDHQAQLWAELTRAYMHRSRHYHNLQHLEQLYAELQPVQPLIADWPGVLAALFYHDLVYQVRRTDNEQRSADLAAARLTAIHLPEAVVQHCHALILATQGHTVSPDPDINYFTDADLAILGKPWPEYERYAAQIRREYRLYPDFLYNPGRKKVLCHFLEMPFIFKTDYFRERYETQARANLARELQSY